MGPSSIAQSVAENAARKKTFTPAYETSSSSEHDEEDEAVRMKVITKRKVMEVVKTAMDPVILSTLMVPIATAVAATAAASHATNPMPMQTSKGFATIPRVHCTPHGRRRYYSEAVSPFPEVPLNNYCRFRMSVVIALLSLVRNFGAHNSW